MLLHLHTSPCLGFTAAHKAPQKRIAAALIIGFLWRHLPFLSSRDEERGSDASPEPPRRPLRTEGLTPSVEQQRHCSAVKTDTQVAAEAMLLAYRRGGRHEVIAQLENLSHIFTTQQSSGHEGQVAITEFCNVVSASSRLLPRVATVLRSPHSYSTFCLFLSWCTRMRST